MAKKVGSIYAEIRAKLDKYEKDLQQAHSQTKSAADKIQKSIDKISFDKAGKSVTSFIGKIGAVYGAFQAINQAIASAQLGAGLIKQEQAFSNLASSAGQSSEKILASLKDLSKGMVADADLIKASGTAIMMGIPADKITDMMKIAEATSRQTGQSVTEAFDNISLGVARQSKLILDNLGIIVSVEKANEDYAKSLGKTATALSDAEKRQAFMNAVLKAGNDLVVRVGETRGDVDGVNRLMASIANLTGETAKLVVKELNPAFSATAGIVDAIAKGVKNMRQGVADLSSNQVDLNIKKTREALINPELGPQQRKYLEDRLEQLERQRGMFAGNAAEAMRLQSKGSSGYQPSMFHFIGSEEARRPWNYKQDTTIIDTSYLDYADKIDKIGNSQNKAAQEAEKFREEIAKLQQEFEEAKMYSGEDSQLSKMEQQLRSGAELSQMYAEAAQTANEEFAKLAERENELLMQKVNEYEKTFKQLDDLSERTAEAMQNNFSDLFFDAITGELKTLEDYADAVFKSIARMVSDLAAQQLTRSLFGPTMQGGGLLSSLFGMFGGGAANLPINRPGYFASVQPFHSGGVVGASGGASKRIPASAFSFAPRLHSGLMPDEYPAVLQKGEAVIPKGRSMNNNVTINIAAPNGVVSRESISQMSAALYASLQRSGRRNT